MINLKKRGFMGLGSIPPKDGLPPVAGAADSKQTGSRAGAKSVPTVGKGIPTLALEKIGAETKDEGLPPLQQRSEMGQTGTGRSIKKIQSASDVLSASGKHRVRSREVREESTTPRPADFEKHMMRRFPPLSSQSSDKMQLRPMSRMGDSSSSIEMGRGSPGDSLGEDDASFKSDSTAGGEFPPLRNTPSGTPSKGWRSGSSMEGGFPSPDGRSSVDGFSGSRSVLGRSFGTDEDDSSYGVDRTPPLDGKGFSPFSILKPISGKSEDGISSGGTPKGGGRVAWEADLEQPPSNVKEGSGSPVKLKPIRALGSSDELEDPAIGAPPPEPRSPDTGPLPPPQVRKSPIDIAREKKILRDASTSAVIQADIRERRRAKKAQGVSPSFMPPAPPPGSPRSDGGASESEDA